MTKEDLKWSYCWHCRVNQAVCPECGKSWCVSDCECKCVQPEWRAIRDEVYKNNEQPELPSYEDMIEQENHFIQYQLFKLFPPTESDYKFYDEMKDKFIAANPHLRPKVYEEKMKEIFNKDFQGFHHKLK